MKTETSTKTKRSSITLTIMFFAMVFTCLCLLIPIWQNAENSRMRSKLESFQSELDEREEMKMALESQIAFRTSPEYLKSQAETIDVDFKRVSETKSLRVACNW